MLGTAGSCNANTVAQSIYKRFTVSFYSNNLPSNTLPVSILSLSPAFWEWLPHALPACMYICTSLLVPAITLQPSMLLGGLCTGLFVWSWFVAVSFPVIFCSHRAPCSPPPLGRIPAQVSSWLCACSPGNLHSSTSKSDSVTPTKFSELYLQHWHTDGAGRAKFFLLQVFCRTSARLCRKNNSDKDLCTLMSLQCLLLATPFCIYCTQSAERAVSTWASGLQRNTFTALSSLSLFVQSSIKQKVSHK